MAEEYSLTPENMNPFMKNMNFAVIGPVVQRAFDIAAQLRRGVEFPFKEVIKAHVGDGHAMGVKANTFLRQVLAAVCDTSLLNNSDIAEDVKTRARAALDNCNGNSIGSYPWVGGLDGIRKMAAEFIEKRDGGVEADWQNIFMTNGASEGLMAFLDLLMRPNGHQKPGVLVPVPLYPIYSAYLAGIGVEMIEYYLDEDQNWALDIDDLKRAVGEARIEDVEPMAIVVINPGNPTGQVLTKANLMDIVRFAHEEKLCILADEVYQKGNVYYDEFPFCSMKKAMAETKLRVELASLMTVSKGPFGECGLRGAYIEMVNFHPEVMKNFRKSLGVKVCPNNVGAIALYVSMNPPVEGDDSYESFSKECKDIFDTMVGKAKLVSKEFNSMSGISCSTIQGSMFAFPRIHLPAKAVEKAEKEGQVPDVFYAYQLLEATGICVVPGSGFGQKKGTFHIRTSILMNEEIMEDMFKRWRIFHESFMRKFAD